MNKISHFGGLIFSIFFQNYLNLLVSICILSKYIEPLKIVYEKIDILDRTEMYSEPP